MNAHRRVLDCKPRSSTVKGLAVSMACVVIATTFVLALTGSPQSKSPSLATEVAKPSARAHVLAVPAAATDSQIATGLRQAIAAHPTEAKLDAATKARVNQAITATKMPRTKQAGFVEAVEGAQVKLRTEGLSQADHDRLVNVLTDGGISSAMAEKLSHDPIALSIIPVTENVSPSSPAQSDQNAELMATRTTSGCKSTTPYLKIVLNSTVGVRLATISYVKWWCWTFYWPNNSVQLPTAKVTTAPRYVPPVYSKTANCLGCKFYTDFHDQYWYTYSGAYVSPTPNNAFALRVNWHSEQCFGVWLFNQCFTVYRSWALNLHPDGTFYYVY